VRAVLFVRSDADRVAPRTARTERSDTVRAQNKVTAKRSSKSEASRLVLGHVVTADTAGELLSAGGRRQDTYTRPCVGSA
jgi:hypothetical protein